MRALTITILVGVFVQFSFGTLDVFVVDEEITKKEWKKIRKKEKAIRKVVDFKSLRHFLVNESKEKKKVVFGEESDPALLDLENNLPQEKWELTHPSINLIK